MKKLVGAGLLAFFAACDEGPKRLGCRRIISVEPHHATRIIVNYEDRNGGIYSDSIHWSRKFYCENGEIDTRAYMDGRKKFGKYILKN